METTIQERLDTINDRIQRACDRVGRDYREVNLVAVSKTHPPAIVSEVSTYGVTVFGESKVQEAKAKIAMCPGHLTWHLVGHLQTNKAHHAVQLFDMIHSVDSLKLLESLAQATDRAGKNIAACIEVNVSGEGSKYGIKEEELPGILEASTQFPHIDLVGLMTIPPWSEETDKTRRYFAKLRALRDRCRDDWNFPLDELSMGMSHDFEIAIEEGATWIRVGSSLFGSRETARPREEKSVPNSKF
ncbi:MAG: YggS family pyridoxal phosphate-dependent enzyme [Kiritimatiellae bacterium]|nr:YggS family pyridoxal phosphate-dependent enzyme [Kiritimatiellia bacterium]